MSRYLPFAVFLFVGCTGPNPQGTSVGNPTEMVARVAVSDDITLDEAVLPVGEMALFYTDGTWEKLAFDEEWDVFAGESIDFESSEWEGLVLLLEEPMTMRGMPRSGDPANFTLDLTGFRLSARGQSVRFDDNIFVLELAFPGWLDGENAGYDPDAEVRVEPDGLVHNNLVTLLAEGTTLFRDDDGDREIREDERRENGEASSRRE